MRWLDGCQVGRDVRTRCVSTSGVTDERCPRCADRAQRVGSARHPPDRPRFPQPRRTRTRPRGPVRRARRRERCRQDQPAGGDLPVRAGPRPAPGRVRHHGAHRRPGRLRGVADPRPGRCRAPARDRAGAAGTGRPHEPALPHRRSAGLLPGGVQRVSPGGLADAGPRRLVPRRGRRPAPVPRSPRAGGGCRPRGARLRDGAGPALAQPAAGGPSRRRPLARRGGAGGGGTGRRRGAGPPGDRRAPRPADRRDPGRRSALPMGLHSPGGRSRRPRGGLAGHRGGGSLPPRPAQRPKPGPRGGPHPDRAAEQRSCGPPRTQGRIRRHGVHRRAEGAADRPRPRPCPSGAAS